MEVWVTSADGDKLVKTGKCAEYFSKLSPDVQGALLLAAKVGNDDLELGNRIYRVMKEAAKEEDIMLNEDDMPVLVRNHFSPDSYKALVQTLKEQVQP